MSINIIGVLQDGKMTRAEHFQIQTGWTDLEPALIGIGRMACLAGKL